MSYSNRITYPLDRETHAMVAELANKHTGANLADMSRLLVEEALENRIELLGQETAKSKIIKRRFLAKLRAENERILYELYMDFLTRGGDDEAYKLELIDFATECKLSYPPLNASPIDIDPNLSKIIRKLEHDGPQVYRDIYRPFNWTKEELEYHLNRLVKFGRINITRNHKGSSVVKLAEI